MMASQAQQLSFGREFVEQVIQWVADHCTPEEVFDAKELEQWAENNDYINKQDLPKEVQDQL